MKRVFCLILALALCAGLVSAAMASEEPAQEAAPAEAPIEDAVPAENPVEETAPAEDAAETDEVPAEDMPEEASEAVPAEEPSEAEVPAEDGAGSVPVDEAHFPDSVFRKYITDKIDTNGDGTLDSAELAAVTDISIGGNNPTAYDNIVSFEGLRYFPELRTMTLRFLGKKWIGESTRIDLDLSGNPALTSLTLYSTIPQKLDLSGNPNLTTLDLYSAGLTELDVSNNPALTSLSCYLNSLTALDLSGNPALTELNCGNNDLTALDLSGCPKLTSLGCRLNELTALDVSCCPDLTYLDCYENKLTALDLSKNTSLTTLYCYRNKLTALDLTHNAVLEDLRCSENPMTALYLGNNSVITSLSCTESQLETLVVTNCTALESLDCSDNRLTALDLSGCPVLESLDCSGNLLSALDVSGCPALRSLYCQDNRIAKLNVTGTELVTAMQKFSYQHGQGYQWYYGIIGDTSYALVTDGTVGITPKISVPVAVGDVILFGHYEQDNDLSNGAEPIEWLVLDRDGDKLLVISKYLLDKKPFNDTKVPVTYPDYMSWESCSLRAWLNGDFMDTAFSAAEKSMIQTTELTTEPTHYGYFTGPLKPIVTEDRVFVLSSQEVRQYFKWAEARGRNPNPYTTALPTAYAAAQQGLQSDPYKSEIYEYGDERYLSYDELSDSPWFVMDVILQASDTISWTLRETDGREEYDTAWVTEDGRVWWDCGYMLTNAGGIRPAMWITYEPEPDPYDADLDGWHTVNDAALLLRTSPWMAAEVLLDAVDIRPLP